MRKFRKIIHKLIICFGLVIGAVYVRQLGDLWEEVLIWTYSTRTLISVHSSGVCDTSHFFTSYGSNAFFASRLQVALGLLTFLPRISTLVHVISCYQLPGVTGVGVVWFSFACLAVWSHILLWRSVQSWSVRIILSVIASSIDYFCVILKGSILWRVEQNHDFFK